MNSPQLHAELLSKLTTTAQQLYEAGKFSDAEGIYLRILAIGSVPAEVHKNYGNLLLRLGRLEDAEKAYLQALTIDNDYGVAYNNLGNVLRLCRRFDDAEKAFTRALQLMPDSPDVHNNFGNLLMDTGRTVEAEQLFCKASLLNPTFSMAYCNRGNALKSLGQLDEAEKCYRQAVAIKPDYFEAYYGLGSCYMQLERPHESEQAFCQAIKINPGFANAYHGLGCVLLRSARYIEAEDAFCQAIKHQPEYAEAHYGHGYVLQILDRIEEAVQAFRQALAIKPLYADAHTALTYGLLLQGHFEEGLSLHELRFIDGYFHLTTGTAKLFKDLSKYTGWKGEKSYGASLLIATEQGAGDSLMMMRYLKLLKSRGFKRLIVYCEAHLKRVFECIEFVDEVVTMDKPLPAGSFDYYCLDMSLPYLFRSNINTIPNTVPYITVPDKMKSAWKTRVNTISGIKIGLVWGGNNKLLIDSKRSIPLSAFEALNKQFGLHLVSLQKGEAANQLKELGWSLHNWMDQCNDFLDTAALINELDLVISVDTSIAHLAGALGKPVWLLNRFGSEWRWMLNRVDSPWYPSMRIFNQIHEGEWGPVIHSVNEEIAKLITV